MPNHRILLKSFRPRPCKEAVEWYNDRDSQAAWQNCQRGDWMLWLAIELCVDRKRIVRGGYACERMLSSLVAVSEAARRYCDREPTLAQVQNAVACIYDIANRALSAAYIIADAGNATFASAAGVEKLAECADIVRQYVPWEVIEEAINKREKNDADSIE